MEQRDDIQLCEKNKDDDYVLYQSSPSPIQSEHASQQLPDDINGVEKSDSQESYDYGAFLVGSQRSLDTTGNAQDMLSEIDSPKRSLAVIQSTSPAFYDAIPDSIDDFEDWLVSRHTHTNDHCEAAAHEKFQSSPQSTPPSSQ